MYDLLDSYGTRKIHSIHAKVAPYPPIAGARWSTPEDGHQSVVKFKDPSEAVRYLDSMRNLLVDTVDEASEMLDTPLRMVELDLKARTVRVSWATDNASLDETSP